MGVADFSQIQPEAMVTSPTVYVYNGANTTWNKPCRFLRANVDGTAVVVDFYGNNITVKFLAGETRAIGTVGVVAAGTTFAAGDLEGMV